MTDIQTINIQMLAQINKLKNYLLFNCVDIQVSVLDDIPRSLVIDDNYNIIGEEPAKLKNIKTGEIHPAVNIVITVKPKIIKFFDKFQLTATTVYPPLSEDIKGYIERVLNKEADKYIYNKLELNDNLISYTKLNWYDSV